MTQMTDKRLNQRVPKLTAWQKRRAGMVLTEFALEAGDMDGLGEVLQMLGLKASPPAPRQARNEYGRAM